MAVFTAEPLLLRSGRFAPDVNSSLMVFFCHALSVDGEPVAVQEFRKQLKQLAGFAPG